MYVYRTRRSRDKERKPKSVRKKNSRIQKLWLEKQWFSVHLVVELQCRDALPEKEPPYVNTSNMKPEKMGKVGSKRFFQASIYHCDIKLGKLF
jgi:hypothetical protein